MPMIADVLDEARLPAADIDLIAATVGPGAYTGIRIGLAAARGLALAVGCPCAGVTTLEALAAAVPEADRRDAAAIVAAVDSRRADVFVQVFDATGAPRGQPAVVDPADAAGLVGGGPVVLVGDAAARLGDAFTQRGIAVRECQAGDVVEPGLVAAIAAADFESGAARPCEPIYLRAAETSSPAAGG